VALRDKILKSSSRVKHKVYDHQVTFSGMELEGIRLSITYDKYEDENTIEIENPEPVIAIINFPNNEVPLVSHSEDNTSAKGFHWYDILPITAQFKFCDRIKIDDLFAHKIKVNDGSYRLLLLQVVDQIVKADVSIGSIDWILAPPTADMSGYSDILTYLGNYLDNGGSW